MKLEVVIFKKLAEYDLDVCFERYEDCLGLMDQVEVEKVWF